jgi:hypothetical protein
VWAPLAQRGRRGQPVDSGQADVHQRDVRLLGQDRGQNGVPVGDLGHHLDVRLQVEH